MTINFTGFVRLRCNLRISFLTKNSPCLPRNGILTHILEMFSSAILLELFSENGLLYGAESLLLCFVLKKVSYFLSKKDKIPDLERNDLVYEFSCPGCSATYIGKTVRNLRTRLTEHAKLNTSAVSEHLTTCEHARHIADLHNLYDNVNDLNPDKPFSDYELITNNTNNTKILQSLQHTNSNILLFLEALHIKFKRPVLNNGLRASKELMLLL